MMWLLSKAYMGLDDQKMDSANYERAAGSCTLIVYGTLLGIGALQLYFAVRLRDFIFGDVTYFELARSIVEKGFYGYDFRPETTLPPGLPWILAAFCVSVSCSHAALVRSMVFFAQMGFIAAYRLLCVMRERKGVAAGICLLLATSPIVFAATSGVMPDLPYFFMSMLVLMLALQLDNAKESRTRVLLWPLFAIVLVAAILIRSAGIALLAGLAAWLTISCFTDRAAAARRLRTFIPALVLGIAVQGGWSLWSVRHEALQWPMIQGYPQSYLKQLGVKNGNYPELGAASLSDIPARIAHNLNDHTVTLVKLLTRKDYVNPTWVSPLILGSVLLTVLGLASSMWPSGGTVVEWYFIGYEMMYLLWPWYGEIRFFLPITPLACLYLWRGAKALVHWISKRPRVVGALTVPLAACLAMSAAAGWRSADLQPKLSAIFWVLVFIASASMLLLRSGKPAAVLTSVLGRLGHPVVRRTKRMAAPNIVGVMIVVALMMGGIAQQVALGRDNLVFDITKQSGYSDIAAAKWIAANTTADAIVMARQPSIVYHYSGRHIVWFPPSSDPQLLMEGIRRNHVEFIIISERRNNYWLPPENVCFDSILDSYSQNFRLVQNNQLFRIFKFIPGASEIGGAIAK